jgi:hypothetical protein
MLTKTANAAIKAITEATVPAITTGAITGVMGSSLLDKNEHKELTRANRLKRDTNLMARGALRGALGGAVGSGLGLGLAHAIRKPQAAPVLALLTGTTGSGLAAAKYTKPSAASLRLNNLERKIKKLERQEK